MHDLTSTAGIVALAAGAVALVTFVIAVGLAITVRRMRAEQRIVLGDRSQDLVSHAAELERQFGALHEYVEDAAARLNNRMETAERRLDRTIAHRSLVRYDAYGEMSGHQSTSIALLDATRSGVVLSTIATRPACTRRSSATGPPSSSSRPRRTRRSAWRSKAAPGALAPPNQPVAPCASVISGPRARSPTRR
jgi:hypothetical protein